MPGNNRGRALWIAEKLAAMTNYAEKITAEDILRAEQEAIAAKKKLDGIEDKATRDQTGAEIKILYEAQPNTNAFTDSEKAKLAKTVISSNDTVLDIISLTEVEYLAIPTPDPQTLYVII